jgi:CCR4-NOT transcription complex subunit 3
LNEVPDPIPLFCYIEQKKSKMSNARKLQTEIDRVMKKVDEGVELFDEIWEKVYSAEQQNQKEKYEMDLKKEIKKLQRLRDQIKSWIGSSDVKDKDSLLEARKLIETKMEAFKVIEKETKTKTYSKEGLARAERLSPEDEARQKTTAWISDIIEQLNQLVEDRDVEIERLSAGKGKKTNKNTIEEYNDYITNHKYHISKLEGIMRLVNNDMLQADLVDDIKEDLEYYTEAYEDDDYMQGYDEEIFYESLGLDELDVVNVDTVTQPSSTTKKEKHDDNDADSASARSTGTGKSAKSRKSAASLNVIPLTIGRARLTSDKGDKGTPTKIGRSASDAVPSNNRKDPTNSTPTVPAPAKVVAPPAGASMAAILKREGEQQEKERQAKALQVEQQRKQQQLREQQARQQAEQLRLQQEQQRQEALRQQQAKQEALQREALKRQQMQEQTRQEEALKQQQQLRAQKDSAKQQVQPVQQPNQNSFGPQGAGRTDGFPHGLLSGLSLGPKDSANSAENGSAGAPLVFSHPKGDHLLRGIMNEAGDLGALEESFRNLPSNLETERPRGYTPRNPYPTPPSFPSVPAQLFENPAIYEKLGTDCLFFIFYYFQGTYQQYLAARELKKQSWRFHKKYMTWFQRHEEPKITTDEYEQGTYVYFDYETGWCQRLKQDFRFEYTYLEDSLIV